MQNYLPQQKLLWQKLHRGCIAIYLVLGLLANLILPAYTTDNNNRPLTNTSTSNNSSDNYSSNCAAINLELLDFYMASPEIDAKLNDPFSSIAALSGNKTKLSDLDISLQNNKLAWSLLGYPTSFGLTYNTNGKFITTSSSSTRMQDLIGLPSDSIKKNKGITLGDFYNM